MKFLTLHLYLCLQHCCLVLSLIGINLVPIRDPSGCFGGQVCSIQPVVVVTDLFGNILKNFSGSVYVQIGVSPIGSGGNALWLGNCDYSSCGILVVGAQAILPLINGTVNFELLQIQKAGTGYTLRYFGVDNNGNQFAVTESNPFDVLVGPVYQLAFATYIGTSTGGVPFYPNPSIAAVDRGGNVVRNVSGFTVRAYLTGPLGANLLRPETSTVTSFFQGVAQFAFLYINEAGFPYTMAFNASIGIYLPVLYSSPFRVGVGPAVSIAFDPATRVSLVPVHGGEFFSITPRILILDAGGNLVVSDSTSTVAITIAANPSNGTLYLAEGGFLAKQGRISTSAMLIDKEGDDYRLNFNLLQYSRARSVYQASHLNLLSEPFSVLPGVPRQLHTLVSAAAATAGGQPFQIQPIIELHDYGGNTVRVSGLGGGSDVEDSLLNMSVTCTMIASLSKGNTIKVRVDTSKSTDKVVNQVLRVEVNGVDSGVYGAGELIIFTVYFRYEIRLMHLGTGGQYPQLRLNAVNVNDTFINATYMLQDFVTPTMVFEYRVQPGDSVAKLDIRSSDALELRDAVFSSSNLTINYMLPERGIGKDISIDTTPPCKLNPM